MKKLLLALSVAAFITSCKSPETRIYFDVEYLGERVVPNETYSKGDTVFKFDLFHYYLSNVLLNDHMVADVIFADQQVDDSFGTLITVDDWGGKKINDITFGVGLDSIQNAQSPAGFSNDHPLSSLNAMYWSWATKYRFIKIDGRVNSTGTFGAEDQLLAWHTGMDELYRTVTLELPVQAEAGDVIRVVLQLEQLMDGVSLATETVTHTAPEDYEIAVKLSNNAAKAWRVELVQ